MCTDGENMNHSDTKLLFFFILTRVMPNSMQYSFRILSLYMKLYYMLD